MLGCLTTETEFTQTAITSSEVNTMSHKLIAGAKRLATCAIVTAIGAGLTTAAQPAHAEPPEFTANCHEYQCDNKDPVQAGCASDARTTDSFNHTYSYVERRYSPTCKANWARTTITAPNTDCATAGPVWVERRHHTGYISSTPTSCTWTVMLGWKTSDLPLRVCASGVGLGINCTTWR